jgi:hypothetical protein
MASNRESGQGSAWAVAPEEEEDIKIKYDNESLDLCM